MLITLERVALLRHVGLFSATPDRVLAGVAQVLAEETFEPGDVVMREGDVESWLYLVVEGELEVTRLDRRVTVGPGTVVASSPPSTPSRGRRR